MRSSVSPHTWSRTLPSTIVVCAFLLISPFAGAQDTTNNSSDAYRPVIDRLNSITTLAEPEWRVSGDVAHPEDQNLDDTRWETMKVEGKWSSGTRVLRRRIEVPEKVDGYAIRGSRLAWPRVFPG
jgi:hypothetical protein